MEYPYLPPNRTIMHVGPENRFMREATKLLSDSGCAKQATGAVVVKNRKIVGRGANAGKRVDICPRVTANYPTGTGYELCRSVCEQVGHAEVVAIHDALSHGEDLRGASLYLDGHWWACKPCWDEILKAGISRVYLRRDSVELYRR